MQCLDDRALWQSSQLLASSKLEGIEPLVNPGLSNWRFYGLDMYRKVRGTERSNWKSFEYQRLNVGINVFSPELLGVRETGAALRRIKCMLHISI